MQPQSAGEIVARLFSPCSHCAQETSSRKLRRLAHQVCFGSPRTTARSGGSRAAVRQIAGRVLCSIGRNSAGSSWTSRFASDQWMVDHLEAGPFDPNAAGKNSEFGKTSPGN